MESLETKKLALIRIWQILKEYSDYKHPLTQEEIARRLENDYGIVLERKAVSRNISLLKEAGIEIKSCRAGSYLDYRDFEDAELRMLIDGVLSSRYITAARSKDLIERICGLSNVYFKSSVKHIHSVNDWSKTDNTTVFFNIDMINRAIERRKQIDYDYNKYGIDKKLHKTSRQRVSPYQMILHNQRYYLMARDERRATWSSTGWIISPTSASPTKRPRRSKTSAATKTGSATKSSPPCRICTRTRRSRSSFLRTRRSSTRSSTGSGPGSGS